MGRERYMGRTRKKIKQLYEKPKAIVLSGVAQGACNQGATHTASQCKLGSSAGGNCWQGGVADSSCKLGQKAVYN
jgi:hypothetical protein